MINEEKVYNLTFNNYPAERMRFELRADYKNVGMTIRIAYPGSEARKVIKDGNTIRMNAWEDVLGKQATIK